MEALCRWCHLFVSTYPIQNWTRRPKLEVQMPDVPFELCMLTDVVTPLEVGLSQYSGPRGMDATDSPGACAPRIPIERST